MSYIVLARKYRPLRFEDMVGQEHVTRTLGNAIVTGRVHHAYLFAGARGLGKTTTARVFAKGLVCERGPTPQPCNACEQCVAVNEGRSVDVVEIDGASNNSVENIRALREQVHYLPQSARRKVYIIDEVHMLTTSAFNALLKTLEEPPAHVNFIFATTEPHKVLPTILSRVSRLDFRRLDPVELVAYLRDILGREEMGVEDEGLHIIARASGGSVRDGLTLLDQVIAFAEDPKTISATEVRQVLGQAERTAVAELVDAILARDPQAVMERFDALVTSGHDLMVLAQQVLEDLRDLMLVKVCRGPEVLRGATPAEFEQLRARAAKVEPVVLSQLFDRLTRVVDRMPHSRVQRLLLEMALLELAYSEPLVPLAELAQKLENLGRGEGGGRPPSGGGGGSRGGTPRRSADEHAAPPVTRPAFEAVAQASARTEPSAASDGHRNGHANGSSHGHTSSSAPVSPNGSSGANGHAHGHASSSAPVPPNGSSGTNGHADAAAAPAERPALDPPHDIGDSDIARGLWNLARESGLLRSDAQPTSEPAAFTETTTRSEPEPPPAAPPAPQSPPATPAARPSEPPAPKVETAVDCIPCRASAPDPIDLDAIEPFAAWERLLERIRDEDEFVSAVLSDVGLVQLADGIIRVAAPPKSFAHTALSQRPDIRAHVEQATRDFFGRSFQLELVDGEPSLPDLPSVVLVGAQRQREHRERVEQEAREHRAIQSVMQLFEAQLTATKPLTDPPRG